MDLILPSEKSSSRTEKWIGNHFINGEHLYDITSEFDSYKLIKSHDNSKLESLDNSDYDGRNVNNESIVNISNQIQTSILVKSGLKKICSGANISKENIVLKSGKSIMLHSTMASFQYCSYALFSANSKIVQSNMKKEKLKYKDDAQQTRGSKRKLPHTTNNDIEQSSILSNKKHLDIMTSHNCINTNITTKGIQSVLSPHLKSSLHNNSPNHNIAFNQKNSFEKSLTCFNQPKFPFVPPYQMFSDMISRNQPGMINMPPSPLQHDEFMSNNPAYMYFLWWRQAQMQMFQMLNYKNSQFMNPYFEQLSQLFLKMKHKNGYNCNLTWCTINNIQPSFVSALKDCNIKTIKNHTMDIENSISIKHSSSYSFWNPTKKCCSLFNFFDTDNQPTENDPLPILETNNDQEIKAFTLGLSNTNANQALLNTSTNTPMETQDESNQFNEKNASYSCSKRFKKKPLVETSPPSHNFVLNESISATKIRDKSLNTIAQSNIAINMEDANRYSNSLPPIDHMISPLMPQCSLLKNRRHVTTESIAISMEDERATQNSNIERFVNSHFPYPSFYMNPPMQSQLSMAAMNSYSALLNMASVCSPVIDERNQHIYPKNHQFPYPCPILPGVNPLQHLFVPPPHYPFQSLHPYFLRPHLPSHLLSPTQQSSFNSSTEENLITNPPTVLNNLNPISNPYMLSPYYYHQLNPLAYGYYNLYNNSYNPVLNKIESSHLPVNNFSKDLHMKESENSVSQNYRALLIRDTLRDPYKIDQILPTIDNNNNESEDDDNVNNGAENSNNQLELTQTSYITFNTHLQSLTPSSFNPYNILEPPDLARILENLKNFHAPHLSTASLVVNTLQYISNANSNVTTITQTPLIVSNFNFNNISNLTTRSQSPMSLDPTISDPFKSSYHNLQILNNSVTTKLSSSFMLASQPEKFICPTCGKYFSKQSQLALHLNAHYFEKPFRCETCRDCFRNKAALNKHKCADKLASSSHCLINGLNASDNKNYIGSVNNSSLNSRESLFNKLGVNCSEGNGSIVTDASKSNVKSTLINASYLTHASTISSNIIASLPLSLNANAPSTLSSISSPYHFPNNTTCYPTPTSSSPTPDPRPFKCDDCQVAFRIQGHLAKHLRSKMHITGLEKNGKVPCGTYAFFDQRASLNDIDTSSCTASLGSLHRLLKQNNCEEEEQLVTILNSKNSNCNIATKTDYSASVTTSPVNNVFSGSKDIINTIATSQSSSGVMPSPYLKIHPKKRTINTELCESQQNNIDENSTTTRSEESNHYNLDVLCSATKYRKKINA